MTWVGIAPPAKISVGIVPGQLGTRSEDVHLSIAAVVVAADVVAAVVVAAVLLLLLLLLLLFCCC